MKSKKSLRSFVTTFGTMSALVATLSNSVLPAYAADAPRPPGQGNGPRPGQPGGGNRPNPQPTASPTSAPTSTPAPAPSAAPSSAPAPTTPAPVDTSKAINEGRADGLPAGQQEGRERGPIDGQREGMQDGQRSGFDRCQDEERRRNQDLGYRSGYEDGARRGNAQGRETGENQGREAGNSEGRSDGLTRANADAQRDATGPGHAEGVAQANASDASAQGQAAGTLKGDEQAKAQALRVDYPRGRKAYYDERYAEPAGSDDFAQRSNVASLDWGGGTSTSGKMADASPILVLAAPGDRDGRGDRNGGPQVASVTPDFRHFKPIRGYPTTEENTAYQAAYRESYIAGVGQGYEASFRPAYNRALEQGIARGCEEARRRDYREYYNRGVEQGIERGYREAYEPARLNAYRTAYNVVFPIASNQAYKESYQGYYASHYEEARRAAYQERYDQLYNAAHEAARVAKYNQVYPGYAQAEYNRGRNDEAADFAARPVRMVDATATETIVNGVYEPGEPLRFRVNLRNFAAGELQKQDVVLKVTARDANSAVITQGSASLVRNLKGKTVTSVREALEFRMNESMDGRTAAFDVTVVYQGRDCGTARVNVATQFQVQVGFAEELTVKDGIPTQAKISIKNVSNKETDSVLNVVFASDGKKLEVANPQQQTTTLAPGETRVLTYTVTAHTAEATAAIPMAISVTGATARRVGLVDRTFMVPVVNDYRVAVTGGPVANLQQAGVVRLTYQVKNVGAQILYRGLQLTARFKNTDAPDNFVVIGPNPQFLWPMLQGETVQFVIPVLVREANAGAVLELEMNEDGRTVVIHRADFRKNPAPLN